MIEFLIFGGLWFWIFFGFISFLTILNLIFSSREETVWIYGILFAILFFISGGIDFSWIASNPLLVIRNIGIYLGIGILWSMKEWYSYVNIRIKELLNESKYKSNFGSKNTNPSIEEQKEFIRINSPRLNWSRITAWITYWPFYILSWILTDPIKKLAQQFRVIYNGITHMQVNKALKNLDKK